MALSSKNYILQDKFLTYPLLTPCLLCLTDNVLFVNSVVKNAKNEFVDIAISDITGCQSVIRKKHTESAAFLRIYSYPMKSFGGILNSSKKRRVRSAVKFVMNSFGQYEENAAIVYKWKCAILWLIRGRQLIINDQLCIPHLAPPTPKLLIMVNPRSGPGKSATIFRDQVAAMLKESDIQYDLFITEKANHTREFVKSCDISNWNGIVVVSGDGLLFEVYNGLMERHDYMKAIKTPVGIVPGGSGNGLAKSICHAASEPFDTSDVTSSILSILRGHLSPLDLVRVQTSEGHYVYSFLSIGWGLMADIDIESEKLRAIGGARFTVWAVIRALGLRVYKGRLSYLPVMDYVSNDKCDNAVKSKVARSKTISSSWVEETEDKKYGSFTPIFRSKSFIDNTSEIPDYMESKDVTLLHFNRSGEFSEYCDTNEHKNCPFPLEHENSCNGISESEACSFFSNGSSTYEDCDISPETFSDTTLPALSDPIPENWITIEDDFVLVYISHQTHLSDSVFLAPNAKLDDGIMWLVIMRSGVSRAQVIYFLSSLQTGEHVHIPYVDIIPIHAFRLEPFQNNALLTVDGEVIPCGTIQGEVLPSVGRIMTP